MTTRLPEFSQAIKSQKFAFAASLVIALAYYIGAQIGFSLAFTTHQVTAVWPPAGIAMASLLFWGRRAAAGVFLGAFISNAASAEPLITAFGIAIGNTLGPMIGGFVLRSVLGFDNAFTKVRHVVVYAIFGAALPMIVTATNGVANLALSGIIPWSAYDSVWPVWWAGDALGSLLFGPLVLLWLRRPVFPWGLRQGGELLILLVLLAIVINISFASSVPTAYVAYPFMIWAALRFGQRETLSAAVLASVIAIWHTAHGRGPFAGHTLDISLILLMSFMATLAVTSLVLGAVTQERRRAEVSLRQIQATLETRIQERASELAETNAELVTSISEANQANRAKSDFLAAISHEIRTPMNALLGFADIMTQSPLLPDQRRAVGQIRTAGDTLLAIINDLLDLSRIETGDLNIESAPVSIRYLAESAVDLVVPSARKKGLAMSYAVASDVPGQVDGDETRLRQILLNLLGNAVKFTAVGRIELRIGLDPADKKRLLFEVEDTGIGIPEEHMSQLFKPFSQVTEAGRMRNNGAGLGLAISRRLIEAMPQGCIGVREAAEGGSIFWFTAALPEVAAPMLAKHTAAPPQGPDFSLSGKHVLVAEDIALNREILGSFLKSAEIKTSFAMNGREAAEAAARESFDAILMDIQMPEMDGVAATQAIRQTPSACQAVPIIAVTAMAMPEHREQFLASGMNDVLIKPVNRDHLIALLSRWITRHAESVTFNDAVAEAEADEIQIIDPATWHEVVTALGHEKFQALLQTFRDQLDSLTESLDSMDAQDFQQAQIHKLAGAAGSLGFNQLMISARTALQTLRNGDVDGMKLAHIQLKAAIATARIATEKPLSF